MITLGVVPYGLQAIINCYGNPDKDSNFILDSYFVDTFLRILSLPFPMRLSWQPEQLIRHIQCHKDILPVLADALREIGEKGFKYLDENQYNWYGGCFSFRKNRRHNRLSVHAWGIAIDLNPQLAPLGLRKHKQPPFIIEAFQKRGFISIPDDAMHFQACDGY
jgi:hypothetical protein